MRWLEARPIRSKDAVGVSNPHERVGRGSLSTYQLLCIVDFLWMNLEPAGDGREDDADDGERPEVSEGVLRGIDDIAEGTRRVRKISKPF